MVITSNIIQLRFASGGCKIKKVSLRLSASAVQKQAVQ
jgi:hypothetical protein